MLFNSWLLVILLHSCSYWMVTEAQLLLPIEIERHSNGDTFKPPPDIKCSEVKGAITTTDRNGVCKCNETYSTVHFQVNENRTKATLECFRIENICPGMFIHIFLLFTKIKLDNGDL